MKLLTAAQLREWDAYTIQNEPIATIDLMERAARRCSDWLLQHGWGKQELHVFCGKGNNGGDGLAIARHLIEQGCTVHTYVLEQGHRGTDDFQTNLHRLHQCTHNIHFIQNEAFFPQLQQDDVVIDALLGTGLSRPLDGLPEKLVAHLNHCGVTGISIDLPTGMFADTSCRGHTVFQARHTLTFQCMKTAFLMPENQDYFGEVHVLDIGLLPEYALIAATQQFLLDDAEVKPLYRKRPPFAHKGQMGHALLLAGSYGKMGAAVLAATACLRSGAGLLTTVLPACGYPIMQTALPEAMVWTDPQQYHLSSLPDSLLAYQAIGMGPGIGLHEHTGRLLLDLLQQAHQPLVLDADALNLLSMKQNWADLLPAETVLTPHPREFERLAGNSANDFERAERAQKLAADLNCYIVLKGHHTFIACTDGSSYFNTSGNAGMATAGSGDVLTGILTGLLAQGYPVKDAVLLGVYLHGLAGDCAARELGEEALLASDITRHLGAAYGKLSNAVAPEQED
ncbi:MAG: NAD(P)H-hydrate dehydratase [Lacibacter sp.]